MDIKLWVAIIGFLAVISGQVINGIIATLNTRKQLLNSLDDKSEWRKNLVQVSSNPSPTIEDIFIVRTTLRIFKKDKRYIEKNSFDDISNEIIDFCTLLENRYDLSKYTGKDFNISIYERKILHLYTRFLLKHHWEENQKKWGDKTSRYVNEQKIIKELRNQKEYTTYFSKKNITTKKQFTIDEYGKVHKLVEAEEKDYIKKQPYNILK